MNKLYTLDDEVIDLRERTERDTDKLDDAIQYAVEAMVRNREQYEIGDIDLLLDIQSHQ